MSKQIKTLDQLKDSSLLYNKKLPAFGYMIVLTVLGLLIGIIVWSINTPKIYVVKSLGVVQSNNKNYVMTPFSGRIENSTLQEGRTVQKGDILFTVRSTDLNLQEKQLTEQKNACEKQIIQYKKLVKCIQQDKNTFDFKITEDILYYSQFEAYKSKISQQVVDTEMLKNYGYSQEQIQAELLKNENEMKEIYFSTINTVENSINQLQNQLVSIDAQLTAIESGKTDYEVRAPESGEIHLISEYKENMVVQAGATIASISLQNDDYHIQAYVSAMDIVRINKGDNVEIAIVGLTQSVFGTISGKLTEIDSDVTVPQNQDNNNNHYFKVKIKPDVDYVINKKGEIIHLSNGLSVETRIQYDRITYFDYVLESIGVLTK